MLGTLMRLGAPWAVDPLHALYALFFGFEQFPLNLGIHPASGCVSRGPATYHAWAAAAAVGAVVGAGLFAPNAVGVLMSWGLGGGNMGLARWYGPSGRLSYRSWVNLGKDIWLGQWRLLRLGLGLQPLLRLGLGLRPLLRLGRWHHTRLAPPRRFRRRVILWFLKPTSRN